jgi:hypothetical protein
MTLDGYKIPVDVHVLTALLGVNLLCFGIFFYSKKLHLFCYADTNAVTFFFTRTTFKTYLKKCKHTFEKKNTHTKWNDTNNIHNN